MKIFVTRILLTVAVFNFFTSCTEAGSDTLGNGVRSTIKLNDDWRFKLGDALELQGQPFSTIRSVGISAGIVSIMGFQMLMIGYFTQFYHVVIFVGIFLVSLIWVYLGDRR